MNLQATKPPTRGKEPHCLAQETGGSTKPTTRIGPPVARIPLPKQRERGCEREPQPRAAPTLTAQLCKPPARGKEADGSAQETGGSKKELAHAARMPGLTSGAPSWMEKEIDAREDLPKEGSGRFGGFDLFPFMCVCYCFINLIY